MGAQEPIKTFLWFKSIKTFLWFKYHYKYVLDKYLDIYFLCFILFCCWINFIQQQNSYHVYVLRLFFFGGGQKPGLQDEEGATDK